jgi:hypothetical protein
LVEGNDIILLSRRKPLCPVPEFIYGNKIVDGGNYLFDDQQMHDFISLEPGSQKYFFPILSGSEFINGENRWCLYLKNIGPNELKSLPQVLDRVEKVKRFREQSSKIPTQNSALTPTLFAEQRQPDKEFILVPRTSSENRKYIPIAFFSKDYIVNDSCIALPWATLYHFGFLTSQMHMTWMKYVCGRLKSDYRYSNSIVYNNFPWPENPTEKQTRTIEDAAQNVLDTRAHFPGNSLADLYDFLTMPPDLVKAHQELDKAVDLCYRPQPFFNETKRIEFLFELYDRYTAGLFAIDLKKKKGTNH